MCTGRYSIGGKAKLAEPRRFVSWYELSAEKKRIPWIFGQRKLNNDPAKRIEGNL